jgi:hypothetical protein
MGLIMKQLSSVLKLPDSVPYILNQHTIDSPSVGKCGRKTSPSPQTCRFFWQPYLRMMMFMEL